MSATSNAGMTAAIRPGRLQPVKRAGRVTDRRGGDLRVAGCGRQVAMAEQRLDNADVSAGFEQMSNEAVAQRVDGDRLVELGCRPRNATGGLQYARIERPAVI